MFLHLSLILFMGRVCLSACWDTHTTPLGRPWADTPPPWQTPPLGRYPFGQMPSWAYTPSPVHAGIHPHCPVHSGIHTHPSPPPPAQSMLGYTWLLLRMVRILLECILVYIRFHSRNIFYVIAKKQVSNRTHMFFVQKLR